MKNEIPGNSSNQSKRVIRKPEDLDLKNQLLSSPELFITEIGSDEYLDRLALKIQLIGGGDLVLSDYVTEVMLKYESKFNKNWFNRLADLYSVDRSVMNQYVKPEFVRQFLVQFIYGRFPYMVLRTLRRRNRKTSKVNNRTKLFQHLTKTASEELDVVIEHVYTMMGACKTPMEFKMKYSSAYHVYFQLDFGF